MQQNNMQMQPMMTAYAPPNQVNSEIIQQYLDENKQLILAILDNQNTGKTEECAQNQAKLQRNLMYLAAIADNQTLGPGGAQYAPNAVVPPGVGGVQNQQAQQMTPPPPPPQSVMTARPSMFYSQSPLSSALQRPQQVTFSGQLGVGAGGFNILRGESSSHGAGGNVPLAAGVFPGFTLGGAGGASGSGKEEGGSALPAQGPGGSSSGGQTGAGGTQLLYLKAPGDQEGN